MGQKANLLTLRKIENVLNIKEENTKFLINILEFLKLFKHFLQLKHILAFRIRLCNDKNICHFEVSLFFLTVKCNLIKKLKRKIQRPTFLFKGKRLGMLFKQFFSFYKKNCFILTFLNLNIKIKKQLVIIFFHKIKKYLKSLFDRRYGLFLDFLKVNSLFCQGLISVASYLLLLSSILKYLTKRNHSKFLDFIKEVFETILVVSPLMFKGIKFLINGKLKGKARAGSHLVSLGQISQQSLCKKVDFGLVHTNTRLGVFGIRMWAYLPFKNK